MKKHWSIETALEQIRACEFECIAGPLANNEAWRWLEDAAKVGPAFWPGQGVWYQVSAVVQGVELKAWKHFYIVGCTMTSDTERRLWVYNLSYDPPAPWHGGTTHFTGVSADKLSLADPTPVPA